MKLFFTFLSFLFSSFVFANNIQLQKVSLTDTNRSAKTVNIKMNISWENSWRDSINWDAAWIIVKYKEPKDSMWKWKHAQLVQSGNDAGTAAGVKIVVPDDLTGAFFYRSAIGEGKIASENVKLLWNYGAAGVTNIDSVEIRVFATEMVYVPEGDFCLGDGNGTNRSLYSFQLKNAPNKYAVITDTWSPLINTKSAHPDDDIIVNQGIRISGIDGIDINNDKVADYPNYPTGYKSFYCMKYKVTQGQYTDFLNTLFANDTTSAALDKDFGTPFHQNKFKAISKELKAVWQPLAAIDLLYFPQDPNKRNTIDIDSVQIKFTVSRPDRAFGLMNIRRVGAFSEWSGLRPMSELEYEKACRGPLPPLQGEAAWGNDSNIELFNGLDKLTFNGPENGTEFFKDYNVTKRRLDVLFYGTNNGDGGLGPVRVGIFATDTSSRISSGASYYGIMDLSKNTTELVMSVSDARERSFRNDSNGKGKLSAYGDNYSFPAIESYNGYTRPSNYKGIAGTSDRGSGGKSSSDSGFRAVRSAPSDN